MKSLFPRIYKTFPFFRVLCFMVFLTNYDEVMNLWMIELLLDISDVIAPMNIHNLTIMTPSKLFVFLVNAFLLLNHCLKYWNNLSTWISNILDVPFSQETLASHYDAFVNSLWLFFLSGFSFTIIHKSQDCREFTSAHS